MTLARVARARPLRLAGLEPLNVDERSLFVNVGDHRDWKAYFDGSDHQTDRGFAISNCEGKIYAAIQSEEGGVTQIKILKYSPFPELPQTK